MPRPALHTAEDVLDAVRDLAVDRGPRAVGIRAISERSGAPSGSLYHRFGSRDELVARAWLRAAERFQRPYVKALQHPDPATGISDAMVAAVRFTRTHPVDAALLLAHARRDLLDGEPSPQTAAALAAVNQPLQAAVADLARRRYGRASVAAVERVTHAVIDLPLAVLRRHLTAGGAVRAPALQALQAAAAALITAELT